MAAPLPPPGNLFQVAAPGPEERFDTLLERPGCRLERIVSHGHATPPGEWLEQDADEWVVLLSGEAALRWEDEPAARELRPGDHIFIPGGRRHRVERTRPGADTVWLALHLDPA